MVVDRMSLCKEGIMAATGGNTKAKAYGLKKTDGGG
jgi:hypothetical protein